MSLDRSFLEAVFGGAEGYAHFAVGRGAYVDEAGNYSHRKWQPLSFLWPQHADKAIRHLDDVLSQLARIVRASSGTGGCRCR